MDNFLIERNARRNRSMAIMLAVGFHLALGAGLYMSASGPGTPAATATTTTQAQPAPKKVAQPMVHKPMEHKRTRPIP